MRSLLSSSRREEGAKGTRSDMRTKEEGRGWRREEKRREEIARELVGPMTVRSGGQWDLLQGYSDPLGFFFFFLINFVMLLHWRSSISKFSQFWAILRKMKVEKRNYPFI
jgi:hypothetical protein